MSTERLLAVLVCGVSLSVGLQVAILYRQNVDTAVRAQASQTQVAPAYNIEDAPSDTTLQLADFEVQGDPGARLVVIEFSDYECPYCERHATTVLPELQKRFVAAGRVRYAFGNLPLAVHPNARLLARAATCAGEQRHYWAMHDALFQRRPRSRADILALAPDIGLNTATFEACLERSAESAKQLERHSQLAARLGFQGTPSFAIGHVDGDGRVVLKKLLVGLQPLAAFEKVITDLTPHGRS